MSSADHVQFALVEGRIMSIPKTKTWGESIAVHLFLIGMQGQCEVRDIFYWCVNHHDFLQPVCPLVLLQKGQEYSRRL